MTLHLFIPTAEGPCTQLNTGPPVLLEKFVHEFCQRNVDSRVSIKTLPADPLAATFASEAALREHQPMMSQDDSVAFSETIANSPAGLLSIGSGMSVAWHSGTGPNGPVTFLKIFGRTK